MAIATGTALLIGAAASGGLQLFGAHKGAKAAKEAAGQQQEGVKEARAYAEPLYANAQRIAAEQLAQGQAGLAPYAQQGGQGLTALSALVGLPAGAAGGSMGAAGPFPAKGAPGVGVPLAQFGAQLVPRATAPAPAGSGATSATQSSYVTLRAPTGEARPVPADQVDYYLARGAQRV